MNDAGQAASPRQLSRLWRTHQQNAGLQTTDVGIGLAASFTIDPLVGFIGGLLLQRGFSNPHIKNANYNQVIRTCLAPSAELGPEPLETIVMLWRLEDMAAGFEVANIAQATDALLDAFVQLRERYTGSIVLALPPRPRPITEGLVEFARSSSLEMLWFESLTKVSTLARSVENTYTIDLESVIAEVGESQSLDHRTDLLYRQPYTETFFLRLAERVLRIHRAKRAASKKCIVVDCDNTLWGGIVGEDGIGGIHLSDDYPGRPFAQFQRQLKVLRDSGIFLALCSKNNPDDVAEVFDNHPGMAISASDVSVFKVNWQPKSKNLQEIAAELNIGTDSLVFVDDNPFEIEEVRTHVSGVTCILAPEDPGELPRTIQAIAYHFDRLEITSDDRKRVDMTRQETERRELSQTLTEEDFLASLGLEIDIYEPSPADQARVSQLINKTNQFNATTRRYSFEEVAALSRGGDTEVFCASVRDRFGDYGLVGIGILRFADAKCVIDSMLMSCRVLGRGVETAMIAHAIQRAASRQFATVVGEYIPTRKNTMVADLFDRHGFKLETGVKGALSIWTRTTHRLPVPDYLSVRALVQA